MSPVCSLCYRGEWSMQWTTVQRMVLQRRTAVRGLGQRGNLSCSNKSFRWEHCKAHSDLQCYPIAQSHSQCINCKSAKARAIEDLSNKTKDELEETIQEGGFTHVQGTLNWHDMNVITVLQGCMLHEVLKFRCNLTDKESLERCHVIPTTQHS